MDSQLPLQAPASADHRPEVLAAFRKQLIDKGVEPGLAGEAAYILAYRGIGDRTEMEQQTIRLAFNDIQWGGQLDA
jgi:hypothetical protein